MSAEVIIKSNMYQDSVALMRISSQISKLPGIIQAAVVMGTPQNKNILEESGLFKPELMAAKPSDLIIVFDAEDPASGRKAIKLVDKLLESPEAGSKSTVKADRNSVSIRTAIQAHPEVNMIAISVPGEFAAAEALKALKSNANVFLFSDNVSIADEVQLKKYAWSKDLILMGPDCGTAYIDEVPFGFVNRVRRGNIGIVGSSGTGIQELMTQIHRLGGGISHVIGTGSHDLSDDVAGLSTKSAIIALEADEATETIVLVSKPASKTVMEHILEALARTGKKLIACLQGFAPEKDYGNIQFANTLQQAACLAVNTTVKPPVCDFADVRVQGKFIRGLFSGGTLASEAYMLLGKEVGPVAFNPADPWRAADNGHFILDMGSDEFTIGKPHPIIDLSDRLAMFKKVAADKETGVILMDLVLGFSAHEDPASELAPYIRQFCGTDGPKVVINLLGTELDFQGYDSQAIKLLEAGAIVLNNNTDAVFTALQLIARDEKGGK